MKTPFGSVQCFKSKYLYDEFKKQVLIVGTFLNKVHLSEDFDPVQIPRVRDRTKSPKRAGPWAAGLAVISRPELSLPADLSGKKY